MIHLFLIGNGFDLAQKLETSYADFIFSYLNKSYIKASEAKDFEYKDILVSIKLRNNYTQEITSLKDFVNPTFFNISFKDDMFKQCFHDAEKKNWADIEYVFFKALSNSFNNGLDNINELNKSLKKIKEELIDYLDKLKYNKSNQDISNIIHKLFEKNPDKDNDSFIFLNFNYTSTLDQYIEDYNNYRKIHTIHIHGKLNDSSNPIIFGYGDESDPIYEKIEQTYNNEYLEHFKSFLYLQTGNYNNLFDLIDDKEYHIYVLGHSCGLSDRVLLKELFENEKCTRITIYPYKKKDGSTDVLEKIQQISRHFSGNSKHNMRRKFFFNMKETI